MKKWGFRILDFPMRTSAWIIAWKFTLISFPSTSPTMLLPTEIFTLRIAQSCIEMESWKLAALESVSRKMKRWGKAENRKGSDFPSAVSFWFHFNHWKHSKEKFVEFSLLLSANVESFRSWDIYDWNDEDSQEKHFIFEIMWKTRKVYSKFSCLLLSLNLTLPFLLIFCEKVTFSIFLLPFPLPHGCCCSSEV